MNILIVDDNKNNRMILRLLLEDYMDENSGIEFLMDEAVDGLQAVKMCDKKEYSIIFMDIMMPNMDGIEATKLIRQKHKKLMIIAVSAVDDASRQKSILNNGAEDYILKPVNADIFTTRIDNYVSLVYARAHQNDLKRSNEEGINLFTKDIFSRYTNFILSSEDALSELWEYFLLDSEGKCDNLSDVVRTVFSISEVQLKLNIFSNLYVEESENFKYFTITKINQIPEKIITLLLKKNEISCEYKIGVEVLTFKLAKIKDTESIEDTIPLNESLPTEEEEIASKVDYRPSKLELFSYLKRDDLFSLEESASYLNSLMFIVGSRHISEDEVTQIHTYMAKIGSILSHYAEVYAIAKAFTSLSTDIATHNERFIQNSKTLRPLCMAFSKNLGTWIEKSFHTGASSIEFMNEAIIANCQAISNILKIDDMVECDDDFDDIFDF